MSIIGISGKTGSGKDTVGEIIQKLCATNNGPEFEIKKFAGKLKTIASLLTGVPVEKWEDQEFKKQEMTEEWWYKNVYDAGWDKKWTKETINYPTNTSTESHIVKTTYRQFLQNLGTEAMRDGLHTNVWCNALFSDYVETQSIFRGKVIEQHSLPNWIITDMRFPNEMKAVVEKGGITIRVTRPGTAAGTHPSETSLDSAEFDYEIINDAEIPELIEKVREILTKSGIL